MKATMRPIQLDPYEARMAAIEGAAERVRDWLATNAGPHFCEHCGQGVDFIGDVQVSDGPTHLLTCPYRILSDALEGR